MISAADQIRNAILGRYPVLYVLTWEEARAIQLLEAFSAKLFGNETAVYTWSCVSGLSGGPTDSDTRDPLRVLQVIAKSQEKGFFVLKDFSHFISDPAVERALRDAYYLLQGKERYIVILSAQLTIPESLKKEVQLVQMGLPDETELLRQLKRIQQLYPQAEFSEELASRVVFALKGLSSNEVNHVLHRIFRSKRNGTDEFLSEIFAEKELIVKKTGYLEFISPSFGIGDIGGLDNLKDWLAKRESLFSQKALDDGMPVPRGLLLMGMSGCGKSLAAKAIAALWKVPLFRLDMNLVFSGMYGSAELAF
ncbi:MAG TPA: AAA family ATPase, partial [Acidobacteriota bacterium]|nr:AAA family ATPase [Acidobacteriota bacterium]